MEVSKSLLNNFAKLIDNSKEKTKPTLEFNARITNVSGDGYYSVIIDGDLEKPSEGNMCLCTSQIGSLDVDDSIRLKIQNGDATIIQKY